MSQEISGKIRGPAGSCKPPGCGVWLINSDLETFCKSTLRWPNTVGSMPLLNDGRLADRRYVRTNSVPNDKTKGAGAGLSEALLVIPSSIVCARWGGGMQLSVSTQETEAFKAGGVLIRLLDSLNIGVRRKTDAILAAMDSP